MTGFFTFYSARIALYSQRVHALRDFTFMRILLKGFASSWCLVEPGKAEGPYDTK